MRGLPVRSNTGGSARVCQPKSAWSQAEAFLEAGLKIRLITVADSKAYLLNTRV